MADPIDSMDDGDGIETLMRRYYPQMIENAYLDAEDEGLPITFDLANEHVQEVINQLAKLIRNVAETTRDEVRALISRQADEGWSTDDLARALDDLAEIRSRWRAKMIARTETGAGYNLGAVAAYREGNVKYVDVLDGDDDEICANANGSRWTLEEAEANPLGHPNCTRAFSPVIESVEE
jgi:hypothetical protein